MQVHVQVFYLKNCVVSSGDCRILVYADISGYQIDGDATIRGLLYLEGIRSGSFFQF